MRLPRGHIGKLRGLVARQQVDHRSGQVAAAHVGERLGVDHVVGVTGPQKRQEVQPALRSRGGKPSEIIVADLGADAVHASMPGAGVIDRHPARRFQPGASHADRLVAKAFLARGQEPEDVALGDA